MRNWKRMICLLCVLCLLPILAPAEETDDEDYSLGDIIDLGEYETVDLDQEDEDALVITDEISSQLTELDLEIDDSIDRGKLDLNENLPDNVINILLVGIDTRSTELEKGEQHGDVQIILSINKDDGSLKLSSLQRDLYVTIPGYKNKNRINVAYHFGQSNPDLNGSGGQLAMRTINRNFEMNIEYYATINFYGLASIIDSLGGVDLELTAAEAKHINSYLRQHPPAYDNQDKGYVRQELEGVDGIQHLDGVQAVMYARTRHAGNSDNDFQRTERQRKLLEVLLRMVMKDMNAVRLLELINNVLPYVTTNMNVTEMFNLALSLLQGGLMERAASGEPLMEQFRIPMDDTFSYRTINGNSVVYVSDDNLRKNVQSLHEFVYGQYIPAN